MNMVIGMLAALCSLATLVGIGVGLIRPKVFQRNGGNIPSRNQILKYGAITFIISTIVLVAAALADKEKRSGQPPAPDLAAKPADVPLVSVNPPSKAVQVIHPEATDASQKLELDDTECKKSAECASKKYDLAAWASCKGAVERQGDGRAKYQVKFDDSMLSHPFFDKTGFKDGQVKGTHSLIYSGNRALFQNGFGAFQRTRYYCAYNLEQKKVEQVRFDQT